MTQTANTVQQTFTSQARKITPKLSATSPLRHLDNCLGRCRSPLHVVVVRRRHGWCRHRLIRWFDVRFAYFRIRSGQLEPCHLHLRQTTHQGPTLCSGLLGSLVFGLAYRARVGIRVSKQVIMYLKRLYCAGKPTLHQLCNNSAIPYHSLPLIHNHNKTR